VAVLPRHRERFAEGSYAAGGRLGGEWILYNRRDEPDCTTRTGVQCEEETLFNGPAGLLRFDYREVQDVHRPDIALLLPLKRSKWDGSGVYDPERGRIK
jgi:hypothetical protein